MEQPTKISSNKWKRSSKACITCRARKVRCDMQALGAPCSNCRFSGTACRPAENHRKKKILKDHCRRCTADLNRPAESNSDSPYPDTPRSLDLDTFVPHGESCMLSPASHDEESDWSWLTRPRLPEEDLDHLQRKGAFKIPEKGLMIELLTSYCNWIHPQLPLLDLHDFLDRVLGHTGRVSLLLFQAVMYAGSVHTDEKIFRQFGYPSKNEAEDVFFGRVKILHHFDCERDLLYAAQAHLLSSISHECSKMSTIWLAQSHLIAQRLGLENRSTYSMMRPEKANLCKRLWWSIFIRDNVLKMELGTPQRIQDVSNEVPTLTVEAFNLQPFSEVVRNALPDATIVDNAEIHRQLAELTVRRADLACHLSQISTLHKVPTPSIMQSQSVYFEQALRNWCSDLDPRLRFKPGSSRVFDYHSGVLGMLYFSTSNALLQNHLQPSPVSAATDLAVRQKIEKDTRKILNIARTLYQSEACFPPTLGMGMVYNAVSLYVGLAEWRSTATDLKNHRHHHHHPLENSLPLDPAIKCLCALIKSTPRGTAVEVALCHLESRINALDVPDKPRQMNLSVPLTLTSISTPSPLDAGILSPPPTDSLASPGPSTPPAPAPATSSAVPEERIMSIDEIFDMAVHSETEFSPQPGFAVSDADEDQNISLKPPRPGIVIPA